MLQSIARGIGSTFVTARSLLWSVRTGVSSGQGLAEYALILALIAIVAIVALIFLGGAISSILSKVGKSV